MDKQTPKTMNRAEAFLKQRGIDPLLPISCDLMCEVKPKTSFSQIELKQLLKDFLNHEVNAISGEEIKEIIFHNQCYGNLTKAIKEIKSLLKQ